MNQEESTNLVRMSKVKKRIGRVGRMEEKRRMRRRFWYLGIAK